jgi:3-deoxy-7-phosphoheptulonate synthase
VSAPAETAATLTPAAFPDLDRSAVLRELANTPAGQQPAWGGHPDLACIRAELADLAPLAALRDVLTLRARLAEVCAGSALVLHVGECAELFAMAEPEHVDRRAALYRSLADRLARASGREVVLIARMAGQHAKPRSQETEQLPDGGHLPVYRGDAVNGLEATAAARRPDPWRLLSGYDRARETVDRLASADGTARTVYLSHESLLRDYEEPLTRGRILYAASTHLPWIGERTREPGGWHVRWAAALANPVAVKAGPGTDPEQALALLRALDPGGEPGRLTMITRMGADRAQERIGELAGAVARRAAGAVVWQCDPMHGNTRRDGARKLRLLPELRAEISAFARALRAHGQLPGGLHLEVTPQDVAECGERAETVDPAAAPPCDPRLNPEQAAEIVDHFAREIQG